MATAAFDSIFMTRRVVGILAVFLVLVSCSSLRKTESAYENGDDAMRRQMVFHEASRQLSSVNYDAAIDLLRHTLALDSCNAASMYELSQLYMSMDRKVLQSLSPVVDSLLEKAVRIEPDNYWYRRLYAISLQRLGRSDESISQYEELAARFPGNTELLLTLAGLYDKNGDFEKELRVLARYGEIEDVADELRMQRVACYLELGETDSAYLESDDPALLLDLLTGHAGEMIEHIESDMDRIQCRTMIGMVSDLSDVAIRHDPGLMQAWKSKATTQVWMGQKEEAMGTLDKGILAVRDSVGKASLFSMRGEFHHMWGDIGKVYQDYDSVMAYNPGDIMTLNNYAYYLSLDGKDLDRALRMSAKTIEAEPLNATYLDTYAWVLFRMGKFRDARPYLEKALQYMETDSPDIYEHYGDVLFKCGDREAALENWHRAKQLNSESKLLDRKIKEENYFEE